MSTGSIISNVWSFCTTLSDDRVGYGDNLEVGLNSFRNVAAKIAG